VIECIVWSLLKEDVDVETYSWTGGKAVVVKVVGHHDHGVGVWTDALFDVAAVEILEHRAL
jgi:hypothetical protein